MRRVRSSDAGSGQPSQGQGRAQGRDPRTQGSLAPARACRSARDLAAYQTSNATRAQERGAGAEAIAPKFVQYQRLTNLIKKLEFEQAARDNADMELVRAALLAERQALKARIRTAQEGPDPDEFVVIQAMHDRYLAVRSALERLAAPAAPARAHAPATAADPIADRASRAAAASAPVRHQSLGPEPRRTVIFVHKNRSVSLAASAAAISTVPAAVAADQAPAPPTPAVPLAPVPEHTADEIAEYSSTSDEEADAFAVRLRCGTGSAARYNSSSSSLDDSACSQDDASDGICPAAAGCAECELDDACFACLSARALTRASSSSSSSPRPPSAPSPPPPRRAPAPASPPPYAQAVAQPLCASELSASAQRAPARPLPAVRPRACPCSIC